MVTASQPIIPVPVTQEIRRKEKIIEVDQTIITDNVVPKVYHQQVFYEVPKLDLDIRERKLNVPQVEIVEEVKEINCAVGFNFKLQPVWEVREVPRLIPKYIGHQEIVEVGVPQVQVIDKKIENEVPIYVGEKIVETEVSVNCEHIFECKSGLRRRGSRACQVRVQGQGRGSHRASSPTRSGC